MRLITLYILISTVFFVNAQKKTINLRFEETSSYCGGAAPTEEVLESLKQKRPFAYQTIYVYRKGKCVDSLKTDSMGMVRKKIRSGNYELFLPWKHFKQAPVETIEEFDTECLKKEWLIADGILCISRKGVAFTNKRIGHQFCAWQFNCLKVRHLPPSAPRQN